MALFPRCNNPVPVVGLMIMSGINVFNFLLMTAKDYLTAIVTGKQIGRAHV